jgi:glycosyltransferase involved in cell wall biosynthesis
MGAHLTAGAFKTWHFPLRWDHHSRSKKALSLLRLAKYLRTSVHPDFLLPYVSEACKITGLVWRLSDAKYCWWNQRDEGRELFGSRLEKRLLENLPDIVSNSWEGRDFLVAKFGLSASRVRVLNNAVVLPELTDGSLWREKLELGVDDQLVLMVANLTAYKDHGTLLRAFSNVVHGPDGLHAHLALAGRLGETTRELKAMAFDLGLQGRLHILGEISEVDPLYDAADLVVHSSTHEGCPNAVLEGMAHGKCIVGPDISGLRQALGANATKQFLSAPGDVPGLARTIRDALMNDSARNLAGHQNSARIASEFSLGGLALEVLNGIEDVCVNSPSTA